MKAIVGALALLLVASCASTWVDPHIHLRSSQVRVECLDDPLGLGSKLENMLNEEGVSTKPADSKAAGDLVLRVTYKFKNENSINSIQSVKAVMVDLRYGKEVARYSWGGNEKSLTKVAQNLVTALTER